MDLEGIQADNQTNLSFTKLAILTQLRFIAHIDTSFDLDYLLNQSSASSMVMLMMLIMAMMKAMNFNQLEVKVPAIMIDWRYSAAKR